MENSCMAAMALKPSLRGEISAAQQMILDEFFPVDMRCGGASAEDYLSVDSFLDIPPGVEERGGLEDNEEEKDVFSASSLEDNNSNISSSSFLHAELTVPDDDFADLEWVSHFVDDSERELSLLVPSKPDRTAGGPRPKADPVGPKVSLSAFFPSHVPARARTKRVRPIRLTKTWTTVASSTISSSTSQSLSFPVGTVDRPADLSPGFIEPDYKKIKKVQPDLTGWDDAVNQPQRRCSHCQVQKTPQWRMGPLGPKTLCNACGVRFKSGRLFPEYRPACSPSFSSEIHSNSHRKVLEMRKRKEMEPNHFVPSF